MPPKRNLESDPPGTRVDDNTTVSLKPGQVKFFVVSIATIVVSITSAWLGIRSDLKEIRMELAKMSQVDWNVADQRSYSNKLKVNNFNLQIPDPDEIRATLRR